MLEILVERIVFCEKGRKWEGSWREDLEIFLLQRLLLKLKLKLLSPEAWSDQRIFQMRVGERAGEAG